MTGFLHPSESVSWPPHVHHLPGPGVEVALQFLCFLQRAELSLSLQVDTLYHHSLPGESHDLLLRGILSNEIY